MRAAAAAAAQRRPPTAPRPPASSCLLPCVCVWGGHPVFCMPALIPLMLMRRQSSMAARNGCLQSLA